MSILNFGLWFRRRVVVFWVVFFFFLRGGGGGGKSCDQFVNQSGIVNVIFRGHYKETFK